MEYGDDNLWGYDKTKEAQPSNTLSVEYEKVAIKNLLNTGSFLGGGKVMGISENEGFQKSTISYI